MIALTLFACGAPKGCDVLVKPGDDDDATLQTALIEAEPDSVVCLDEGTFRLTREISLAVDGVTVRGDAAGSVLDFSGQSAGANGLLVTGDRITLDAFETVDTAGDAIRADKVADILFKDLRVRWTEPESVENGAYGLYPVGSSGVTIDGCVVSDARDAGVYVGQSTDIEIVGVEAFGNVAGIEVENSTDAVVYDSYAHHNTAGLLVFNLPGLPVQGGKRTEAYDNVIEDNNTANFAEVGTVVADVPPGSGVLLIASDDNHFHHNTITGNDSAGFAALSYLEIVFGVWDDDAFDPHATGNRVHDNLFADNGANPLGLVGALVDGEGPDMLWDGCSDPAGAAAFCAYDNGDASFWSVDLCVEQGAPHAEMPECES